MTQARPAPASDPRLSEEMSIFLDAVRFGAALVVVFNHLGAAQLGGAWMNTIYLGYVAVMTFFVMSGFVIGYVADGREHGLRVFMASRLARLWSVLLPALLLTAILDAIGRGMAPGAYQGWDHYMAWDRPFLRLGAAALFLNEIWFQSIAPLSNAPVWSLGFEFWYYVIFAFAAFTAGSVRMLLVIAAAAVAGPKILLLMPVWLAGWAAWKLVKRRVVPEAAGWALVIIAPSLLLAGIGLRVGWKLLDLERGLLGQPILDQLGYAAEVVWGWVIGLLVAAAFVGFASVGHRLSGLLRPLSRAIRFGAAMTLSIYLVHLPVLMFASAVLRRQSNGPLRTAELGLAALAVSLVFSILFENHRRLWRRLLEDLFSRLGGLALRPARAPDPAA